MTAPLVSIVVPTRNRPDALSSTLDDLLAQDPGSACEVVVVDDGSEPPVTVPSGVRLVRHHHGRGLNAARNTGIRAAAGELVCFVDDDVSIPGGWLEAIVEGAARHPDAACFGGPIRLLVEGGRIRSCADCPSGETELELAAGEGAVEHGVYGANMALRRSAVEHFGPFAERQPIYFDEIEWQRRARRGGGTVVYLPDAWLWHRRTRDDLRLRARLRRHFRRGYGQASFLTSEGRPPTFVASLRGLPGLLLHAVRRRCVFGLLAAAGELGLLWWVLTQRTRARA